LGSPSLRCASLPLPSFSFSQLSLRARHTRTPLSFRRGFTAPWFRRGIGPSPNLRACLRGIAAAPRASCSRSAEPCDLPSDVAHVSEDHHAVQIHRNESGTPPALQPLPKT